MADETQSSSQGETQAQTGAQSQQASTSGASETSQGSQTQAQATTSQQASTAPTRPEGVPDRYWNAEKGVDHSAWAKDYNEHVAFKAAEDSKRLTLPPAPDAYKVELPKTFTPPQGVDVKIDEANPLWAQAKEWAHKRGLSQEAFSEGIALVMGDRVATEQTVAAARSAEVAKLGATGTARVDAVTTWAKAMLGDQAGNQFASRLFTASDIQNAEALIAKFTSQGAGSFKRNGGEPDAGARLTQEQYDRLTYTQQKEYAAKFPQSQDAVH